MRCWILSNRCQPKSARSLHKLSPVVGLCHRHLLSLILLVKLMDWMSMRCHDDESVWFGKLRIVCL